MKSFRVWDIENECWVKEEFVNYNLGMIISLKDKYIVEQYIMLKDKNGIKIYEGDRVANGRVISDTDISTVVFGKIGYDNSYNGMTGFALESWKCDDDGFYELDYTFHAAGLEVVGNIHEGESK